MDPILLRAIRLLRQAQRNARGVAFSPEDQEAFLREETGGRFGLRDAQGILAGFDSDIGARNLGRSFAQGATFNFADELLGLVAGDDAREEMRLRDELFKEAHPTADALAGLAGGVSTSFLPGLAPARALTTGAAAARGAFTGVASGALAGAGAGEGIDDRLDNALEGGLFGGAFGAAIPGASGVAKSIFSPAARAGRRLSHAIEQSGGKDVLRRNVDDIVATGRGDEVVLGDLSPRLRRETDFAANNSDDALVSLAEKVGARQQGQSSRLLADVRELAGNPRGKARLKELVAERRAWAKSDEGFEGMRKANPQLNAMTVGAEIGQYLDQPIVKRAFEKAQKLGLIGEVPDTGKPSFQVLQDLKEDLDDAVSSAFNRGNGNLGTRLGEVRDNIVAFLENNIEGYAERSAKYAQFKAREKALVLGSKMWDVDDVSELRDAVASMSPEVLNEFRVGMASKLVSRLRRAQTNRDEAKRLLDAGPALQEKLQLVFGSKETFDEFMRRVGAEAGMAKLSRAFGGSDTHRRAAAAGFDPAEVGLSAATQGLTMAATGAAARGVRGARTRNTAAALAPFLSTQGAPAIQQLLDGWDLSNPLVNRVFSTRLPMAVPSLLY